MRYMSFVTLTDEHTGRRRILHAAQYRVRQPLAGCVYLVFVLCVQRHRDYRSVQFLCYSLIASDVLLFPSFLSRITIPAVRKAVTRTPCIPLGGPSFLYFFMRTTITSFGHANTFDIRTMTLLEDAILDASTCPAYDYRSLAVLVRILYCCIAKPSTTVDIFFLDSIVNSWFSCTVIAVVQPESPGRMRKTYHQADETICAVPFRLSSPKHG